LHLAGIRHIQIAITSAIQEDETCEGKDRDQQKAEIDVKRYL